MGLRVFVGIGIALLLGIQPQPAHAYKLYDGNMLLAMCDERAGGEYSQFYCDAYVRGAFERYFVELARKLGKTPECIPWSASNQQIRDVIVEYLNDHPTMRHRFAADLVESAMIDAFGRCDG